MTEIEVLRKRLFAARDEFRGMRERTGGRPGGEEPASAGDWGRGEVLGHMADILVFWSDQLTRALDGASWIGRGADGYAARQQAILEGTRVDETVLRARIEEGLQKVVLLLDRVRPEDLDRTVEHRRAVETKVKTIRQLLDEILVGHFEAHVAQLREVR